MTRRSAARIELRRIQRMRGWYHGEIAIAGFTLRIVAACSPRSRGWRGLHKRRLPERGPI